MKIYQIETTDGQHCWASSVDGQCFTRLLGDFPDYRPSGEELAVRRLLAPLQPPTIYCIGLNYRAHAAETGSELPRYPVLFMKAPSSVIGPNQAVELPRHLPSAKVDYEVELAVVIGRQGKNIPEAEAMDYVFGYTIANDISARDWQKHAGGGQWVRAKTFDTFCPLGPALVTASEIPQLEDVRLRCFINGEPRQDSTVADMIFTVPQIISYLSGSTTLQPGTVILTGTPEGVGMGRRPMTFLKPGDQMRLEIDHLGVLENPVVEEPLI